MIIREKLSADGLHRTLSGVFDKVTDHRKNSENIKITMTDALKSGFAVFSLKCPSLLNFEAKCNSIEEGENIKSLYGINRIASDTQLRDILDPVSPKEIAPAFKQIFGAIQRGKKLEPFVWGVNKSYLGALDATGFFSSSNIKCDHCLIKNLKSKAAKELKKEIESQVKKEFKDELKKIKIKKEKNNFIQGKVNPILTERLEAEDYPVDQVYQHQMLGFAMVHPDQKITIPFCPEPIMNTDGSTKNDCEMNASKRLIEQFRKDHPHLRMTVLGDDLYSNAPLIKLLGDYKMNYLLVAKETSHKFLFEYIESMKNLTAIEREDFPELPRVEFLETTEVVGEKILKTITRKFKFINGVPLNESNQDIKVNFLEYWEHEDYTDKDGVHRSRQRFHSSWITDIEITKDNAHEIMKGGRSRWNIENCVFNTLKNQGYQLDHSFGHGKKNLSTNFAMLMMLAFLVDQVQELCCKLFQEARKKLKTKYGLWERIRYLLTDFKFKNWEMLLKKIVYNLQLPAEIGIINTG